MSADATGTLYVADICNNRIRKITSGGMVSTLAGSDRHGYLDGSSDVAQFNIPAMAAVNGTGDTLYVSDALNNRIRKIVLTAR